MLFPEIISWKGVSCFNGGEGGGCFSDGGASFLSGGGPMGGGIGVGRGFLKKNRKMPPPFMGNPDTCFIKKLSNQLYANYLFPINKTLESIKQMNFKSCLKFLSTFNVPEVYSELCQTPEMD